MGLKLILNAQLENLTGLEPVDTAEQPFEYTFEIQCTACREVHPKEVAINRFERHDIPGSRGEANFVFRCKACKKESNASITRTGKTYDLEDSETDVAVLEIEARGLEFVRFVPDGFFRARGAESGTPFDEIELNDGEFYDYDDNAGNEVSVTEVRWELKLVK